MSLAERIKETRIRAGLTQTALAQKCGIAPASLNGLESGKSKSMRQDTLLRMSKALGQTPEWLAFGEGESGQAPLQSPESDFEKNFLADVRKLSAAERKIVVRMVRALVMDK